MNIAQLNTFVSLARTLNYSQTARQLFISQPAVTQQIAKLESELGLHLFERSTRGVALTAAGKTYYEDCLDILARIETASARAKNQAQRACEELRVGCAIWAFLLRLNRLVARICHTVPHVQTTLVQDETEALLGELYREELDVVFAARSNKTSSSNIVFEHLFDGRLVCVAATGSALAQQATMRLSELDGHTLLMLEDSMCPAEMREIQSAVALATPRSPVFYNTSETIGAALACGGAGFAVMPDFVCPPLENATCIAIADYPPIPFGIYHRKRDVRGSVGAAIQAAHELYGDRPA